MLAVVGLRAPPGRPGRSLSAESEVFEGSASQEAGNKRRSELINGTWELSRGEESESGEALEAQVPRWLSCRDVTKGMKT